MHELAICQSLIDQLNDIASDYPGRKIATVHIQVGPLSGVVPQLLKDAFPLASAGTVAENATLKCHASDIQVHCPKCGKDSEAGSNNMICHNCGNWQTELISGDELMLRQVELESQDDEAKVPEGEMLH